KKNPAYLQEQGLRIFSDWSEETPEIDGRSVHWDLLGPDTFPFRLRQDPGPKNALGRIKFIFPNKFSVYLHDTPSRTLFQKTTRNFSSGCIRVEKPVSLAVYLLRDEKQWTRKRIQETIRSGKRVAIPLRRPIPVHLQYWTAWVDELGRLQFRDDIYDRDGPLERALQERLPAG
ncbi:MAG: L,D-transpeptidase family protein, partial [Deltaproteobacteria bacterium]